MGEKVTFDFRLRKCAKEGLQLQPMDRISQLPNEILVYILSFLTLEDAARTSVLSKHWMHTLMSVSTLNFDSAKMWQGIEGIDEMVKYKILRSNRLKYVQWVNMVLLSHKSMVLDAFRIRFDLGKSSQNDIDRWLQYAFARRVQRLDLNLLKYGDLPCGKPNAYTFPHRLLDLSNGNSSSCGNGINSDASFGFKSLRVLTFNNERAKDVALPQLTKLKQLTFVVLASQNDSLIVFTSLIRASPKLEKFVLKLEWLDDIARKRTESKKGLAFPLRRLKVVELCGYYGRTTEVELLEYFIQNAVALERIIVDSCDRSFYCPFLHKPEEGE